MMLVRARILSAKCVQETLAAAQQALARLEAGARQPAAAAALPAAAPDLAPGSGASDGTPELARFAMSSCTQCHNFVGPYHGILTLLNGDHMRTPIVVV